nr:hypothetical protein Iba_chr14aCG5470 [Ipomoea batatas]
MAAATNQSMNLLLLLIVMASSSPTFTSFLTIIADQSVNMILELILFFQTGGDSRSSLTMTPLAWVEHDGWSNWRRRRRCDGRNSERRCAR